MKRCFIAGAAVSLAISSIAWAQEVLTEYQQVLTTLGKQGEYKANVLKVNIPRNDVVAIHHHMTDTQPTVFFLHYWGTGPAEKLATGFKAAVNELGKSSTTSARR